ncbi:MAG: hypothetical protein Kow0092_36200 [Deferrisomatales bacterium]
MRAAARRALGGGLFLIAAAGPAAAAVFWEAGLRSRDIRVCFVGDSLARNPAFAARVMDYMGDFEEAANIRFQFIGGGVCPAAVPHPTRPGDDYYDGDIRIILPGVATVSPFGLVPGVGCPPDPNFIDPLTGLYNGKNDGWGSWANPPNDLEVRRSCVYNVKLGTDGDATGTPWRSHTLHEIGHALGLAHEHERNDAPPGCGIGGGLASGLVTPYDRDSVMHYQFLACGIHGNYSQAGFSAWDRLALHILYPEDVRVAEFVGRTVIEAGEALSLQSLWQAQGALVGSIAKDFRWRLDGVLVGTGPMLHHPIASPGTYTLEFSYSDNLKGIPARSYLYRGPVRVLPRGGSGAFAAAVEAAQAVLASPASVSSCLGDFDANRSVDRNDLARIARTFGRPCTGGGPCLGDFDLDRVVDGSDFSAFAWHVGRRDCY